MLRLLATISKSVTIFTELLLYFVFYCWNSESIINVPAGGTDFQYQCTTPQEFFIIFENPVFHAPVSLSGWKLPPKFVHWGRIWSCFSWWVWWYKINYQLCTGRQSFSLKPCNTLAISKLASSSILMDVLLWVSIRDWDHWQMQGAMDSLMYCILIQQPGNMLKKSLLVIYL